MVLSGPMDHPALDRGVGVCLNRRPLASPSPRTTLGSLEVSRLFGKQAPGGGEYPARERPL